MTKRDIANILAEKYKISQVDSKKIVQGTFDTIIETLLKNGRIELRNFGVFIVKHRKARKARNPRTGAQVMVPEKKVVTFKPGRLMQNKIK
ncbi:MAG: integration host factor subunit beta [Planctomycetes bacterium]|nr:integration host factor subunit beta [Planctomycetota bacterium]MCK5578585.1 integration host factor subunit beta [Planctomycetota bacterium]